MDCMNDMPHPGSPTVAMASDATTLKAAVGVIEDSQNGPSAPKLNKPQKQVATAAVGNGDSPRTYKHVSVTKGVIDTAAPFQSVKAALSKFDGSIDWKARRTQSMERRKMLEIIGKVEENPAQKKRSEATEDDLNKTTKLLEELKNNLERAQREESQAKQDAEAARLQIEKMEQEIANEVSMVAKAQVEVDEVWHIAAESGLESMKEQLEALREEYASLVTERDLAVRKAEEAAAASKEVELLVEEDLKSLNQQASSVEDLKSKLDAASALLLKLKADFKAYVESNLKQEGEKERREELEEVKLNTEKATVEINCLKVAAMSIKAELEQKISSFTTIRQREGMASTGKMIDIALKEAAQEANQAKSLAQAANIALSKAKEEAEQAKARARTMETRLLAARKEVEAAMAFETLGTAEAKASQGNELTTSNNDPESSSKATLLLDEYLKLSKQAHEAEEQANIRIADANSQVEMAKESELRSLEKLEDLEKELAERQESLEVAREKAEKAKEKKLGVEQELRKWRDELKQQRKAEELNQGVVNQKKTVDQSHAAAVPRDGLTNRKAKLPSHPPQTGSTQVTKTKKKKKSFFPRIVRFFSKRKTHPTK